MHLNVCRSLDFRLYSSIPQIQRFGSFCAVSITNSEDACVYKHTGLILHVYFFHYPIFFSFCFHFRISFYFIEFQFVKLVVAISTTYPLRDLFYFVYMFFLFVLLFDGVLNKMDACDSDASFNDLCLAFGYI